MAYNLFLFDADETLLDFRASEKISFKNMFRDLGITQDLDPIFATYRKESDLLWGMLEQGKVDKEFLKVERYRKTFAAHKVDADPQKASQLFLDYLPQTVALIDHAIEICEFLGRHGEVGIITNGIEHVQIERLKKSGLEPHISFMAVSEACGFAKPDVRIFEYAAGLAKNFSKGSALMIGDRIETDILGAHNFGIDACLFNPMKIKIEGEISPRYEISHLSELKKLV